jgi:hypothetical protein
MLCSRQHVGQGRPAIIACDVHPDVAKALDEPLRRNAVVPSVRDERAQVILHLLAVSSVVKPSPRDRDHPRLGRDLPVAIAQVQSRQQLADRQIPGAAENHDIVGGDRFKM